MAAAVHEIQTNSNETDSKHTIDIGRPKKKDDHLFCLYTTLKEKAKKNARINKQCK